MLTLRYIPYQEIENLSSNKRISLILSLVKQDNIVLLQGRLKKDEESQLIEKTMKSISQKFKGIEIGVIYPEKEKDATIIKSLKNKFINFLLGDRKGITLIGPASIVKEIKRDPNKIQLLFEEKKKSKKLKKTKKN